MSGAKFTLITGASSGIGAATAKLLAKAGHHLFLVARRDSRLSSLAKELTRQYGIKVVSLPADVRDFAALEALFKKNAGGLAKLTAIINNAGLALGLHPLHQGELSDWRQMLDTNVMGLLHVSRLLIPILVKNGSGHIVNIGSIAGRQSYPNGNVYCASKAAVRMLNESMRLDLHGKGIRVTAIDPGLCESEFSLVRFHGDVQRAKTPYQGMTPLTPDDVAEAILWALERPNHVNVQEILLMPLDQASASLVDRHSPPPSQP